MTDSLIPGKTFTLGDTDYVIPPLSLGQLRNGAKALLQQHDELVTAGKAMDSWDVQAQVIMLAIKRNYPDVKEETLLEALDLGNMREIWFSVLGMSGFKPGEAEAAKALGT